MKKRTNVHPLDMKKILLPLFLMLCSTVLFAQKKGASRLYAYQEPVSKGKSPGKELSEDGGQKAHEQSSSYNYFIYLSSTVTVTPSEIWIKGKQFNVTSKRVTTPVERTNGAVIDPKTQTLVKKTTNRVLLLTPVVATRKPSKLGKSLSSSNDVVLIYSSAGKAYYTTLKSIITLEAVSAM